MARVRNGMVYGRGRVRWGGEGGGGWPSRWGRAWWGGGVPAVIGRSCDRLRRRCVRFHQLVAGLRRLDPVGDRIQILVRGTEALQHTSERINFRAVGLRPAGGQLDTGDRVVTAADADAFAAAIAILASVVVARVAADALTCAHGAQL